VEHRLSPAAGRNVGEGLRPLKRIAQRYGARARRGGVDSPPPACERGGFSGRELLAACAPVRAVGSRRRIQRGHVRGRVRLRRWTLVRRIIAGADRRFRRFQAAMLRRDII
jgi:hypothetical protein